MVQVFWNKILLNLSKVSLKYFRLTSKVKVVWKDIYLFIHFSVHRYIINVYLVLYWILYSLRKSQPWRGFGYAVVFSIVVIHFLTILFLSLLLSYCFNQEDISNTRDCVSSAIQTLNFIKILCCTSYFQLSSRYLDIQMKHRLSCLIYITCQ